jgi:hypothetical protein
MASFVAATARAFFQDVNILRSLSVAHYVKDADDVITSRFFPASSASSFNLMRVAASDSVDVSSI